MSQIMNLDQLSEIVTTALDDNKAVDVKTIDVRKLTSITDYMIICSATSTRHAKTIADKVLRATRDHGIKHIGVEGEADSDWVLIDLSDIVVHIMLPSAREFYSLEKLWTVTEKARKKATN